MGRTQQHRSNRSPLALPLRGFRVDVDGGDAVLRGGDEDGHSGGEAVQARGLAVDCDLGRRRDVIFFRGVSGEHINRDRSQMDRSDVIGRIRPGRCRVFLRFSGAECFRRK